MTDKELRKLSREELLEILIEQRLEIETMKSQLLESTSDLKDRQRWMENVNLIVESVSRVEKICGQIESGGGQPELEEKFLQKQEALLQQGKHTEEQFLQKQEALLQQGKQIEVQLLQKQETLLQQGKQMEVQLLQKQEALIQQGKQIEEQLLQRQEALQQRDKEREELLLQKQEALMRQTNRLEQEILWQNDVLLVHKELLRDKSAGEEKKPVVAEPSEESRKAKKTTGGAAKRVAAKVQDMPRPSMRVTTQREKFPIVYEKLKKWEKYMNRKKIRGHVYE